MQDIDGKDVALSKFKGRALLIVNVASQWYFFIIHCSSDILYTNIVSYTVLPGIKLHAVLSIPVG